MLSNLSSADAVKARGGFVSRAIMIENFRRFWPIGLVAFIVYLVSGPLPVLMRLLTIDPGATGVASGDIDLTMWLHIGADAVVGIIVAAVAAIAVFRYTHSSSSLAVVHAFPVERSVLFRSNLLSGFLLFIVPYIVSVLLSLPVMGYYVNYIKEHFSVDVDMSTWPLLICANIVIMLYTYAVTVLAGMVSGNTPVHIMTAAIFNFALMYIVLFGEMLAAKFLIGMNMTGTTNSFDILQYFHPLLYYADADLSSAGASVVPGVMLLVYAAVSALIAAIAWLLYRSFKTERAGDSITYRAVEYIFACVVAVAGLFLGGELLGNTGIYSLSRIPGSSGYGGIDYVDTGYITGAFIGAAVAFTVATMIIRKSVRVFDVRLLRRFAAFAVAAAVFFVCIMTNITGFETRVPAVSGVSTGAFATGWSLSAMPPYKQGTDSINGMTFIPIEGEKDIRTLEEFHRSIIDEQTYLSAVDEYGRPSSYDGSYFLSGEMYITYALKNGTSESREYMLPNDFISGSEAFARLISCDSVKKYRTIKNLLGYDALDTPELYCFWPDGGSEAVSLDTDVRQKLTGDALKELAACLDEDYLAMSADDMMNPGAELFTLQLPSKRAEGTLYESVAAAASGNGEPIYKLMKEYNIDAYPINYTVTEKSVKTVAWLKDAGVYDSLMRSTEELKEKYERDHITGDFLVD
jgi:ABC-2 type transport system permease protein